jgi:formylglycine-generating enzyme required for sulfatase activity
MANHIFISYAREDQPYARALADHLRQRGFDTWMDDRIDFGDRWWQTIVENLRASAAFVVVMTPDSANSAWVHREVLLALEERKPIFPLLLRGKRFPILVDVQYATVTGDRMPPDNFCDRLREVAPAQKPAPRILEPEMILIPAGDFLMGSDLAKDDWSMDVEQPQHTLRLPGYYIARTPITNAQYAAFVEATGHRSPWYRKRNEPPQAIQDHPVVNVSWHDALAYCGWLTELTGKPYRLPSEAEWEKAARGTRGRIYPWGDEWDPRRCNSEENDIDDTTPVGAYPSGASPYGLLDMAGNVWEWTRSLRRRYPYDPKDGREDLGARGRRVRRVMRGGAFNDQAWVVRCTYRLWFAPDARGRIIGFRVVAYPVARTVARVLATKRRPSPLG